MCVCVFNRNMINCPVRRCIIYVTVVKSFQISVGFFVHLLRKFSNTIQKMTIPKTEGDSLVLSPSPRLASQWLKENSVRHPVAALRAWSSASASAHLKQDFFSFNKPEYQDYP